MENILTFINELAPIGAVITFALGLIQFKRSTELGFRKPYWEKLLELYVEACSSAAILAQTNVESEWSSARNSFWKLYYGPLCLVEDQKVEEAMVMFGEALEGSTFSNKDTKRLSSLSLGLAYACRNSIRADWRVPLEDLIGQKK